MTTTSKFCCSLMFLSPCLFLLPSGEGGAKRRMRVRRSRDVRTDYCNRELRDRRFAVPSPQPLSRRERGLKAITCPTASDEIGRASCRERDERSVGAVCL